MGSNPNSKEDPMRNDEPLKRYPNRHRSGRHSDPAVGGFRMTKAVMPQPESIELRCDPLARGILRLRRFRNGGHSDSAGAAVAA